MSTDDETRHAMRAAWWRVVARVRVADETQITSEDVAREILAGQGIAFDALSPELRAIATQAAAECLYHWFDEQQQPTKYGFML